MGEAGRFRRFMPLLPAEVILGFHGHIWLGGGRLDCLSITAAAVFDYRRHGWRARLTILLYAEFRHRRNSAVMLPVMAPLFDGFWASKIGLRIRCLFSVD